MANENAINDSNNVKSMLGSNAAGTESRRVVINDDGSINVGESAEAGQSAIFSSIDLDESEEEVSDVDMIITGYYISNRSGSEKFIKFYAGTAAEVAVGTTTPVIVIPLVAGQSANLTGIKALFEGGCCVAATTGVAHNDTGAPSANDVVANIFYREV